MKKKGIIIGAGVLFLFFALIIGGIIYYNVSLSPVSKNAKENIEFEVKSGTSANSIIESLEKENLIKSALTLKIYSKFHKGTMQAGTYILTQSMSAKEIYDALLNGKVTYDTVWITFVEGKRLSYIEKQIAENFDYTLEDVEEVMDDEDFIKELISKYDILTDDILNSDIYHPLEGYLFPDTYEFMSTATIKEIIETMVATTDSKLSAYKEEIENSTLSIHEIMTLASIVEMEGTNSENRPIIAGVFMNRLKKGDYLGSDVTTYYSVNKDFGDDLLMSELKSCNGYNTSSYGCHTGLPVGPIASSSMTSITSAISPDTNDYYYFVSDKNKNIYFSKTYAEHVNTVNDLKNKGLWYEY